MTNAALKSSIVIGVFSLISIISNFSWFWMEHHKLWFNSI